MASETVANLFDLLKEVWTQDRLNRQFYDGTRWLDKVEKTNKYTIGRRAQVPIEKSLPGGYTVTGPAGSTALNAADALHVDRADYELTYHYQQVSLQVAALNQADSVGVRSTVDAADQTIVSNTLALRKEVNRQSVGNQDGLIAATTGSATSTEVELSSTGYGFDAITRGWLRPGVVVDIGTAANEVSAAADRTITAVEEVAATPSITVSGAAVVLTANEFVSIANARAGAVSLEMNGLRQIAGSTTLAVGGLDPDTAGEEFWKPASVDTTTTVVSLDLLLTLQERVNQKTGKKPTYVTTSIRQQAQLYALFQNQVRFDPDTSSAGNVDGFKWNGMSVNPDPDIPNRELYMLSLEDFLVVTGGRFGKPTWMSDIEGSGGRFRWAQGATNLVNAMVYPIQLAVKRRNSHAAAIALTG